VKKLPGYVSDNLTSYVKVYRNAVPQDLCEKAIDSLNETEFFQHTFYHPALKQRYTNSNELSVSHIENKHSIQIDDLVYQTLVKYVTGLDFSWFDSFDGHTKIRFNKYDVNTEMSMHCDRVQEMFDGHIKGIPTLSVLGLLNDNYEGGKFVMFNDTSFDLKQGDIIIFPSTFMYPHHVTPITKGTRFSFISWVW